QSPIAKCRCQHSGRPIASPRPGLTCTSQSCPSRSTHFHNRRSHILHLSRQFGTAFQEESATNQRRRSSRGTRFRIAETSEEYVIDDSEPRSKRKVRPIRGGAHHVAAGKILALSSWN